MQIANLKSKIPLRRFLRATWIYPKAAISKFSNDSCPLMAAAIAFYGLLSIIPLLLLGLAALGFFLGSSDEAVGKLLESAYQFLPPEGLEKVDQVLTSLIEKRTLAGGLGLLSLLWVGHGAFEAIEQSINVIYKVKETRGFFRRKLTSLLLMGLTGTLFLSALVLSAIATALRALGSRVLAFLPFPFLQEMAARFSLATWNALLALIPMVLIIAMFTVIYAVAPTRKIWFSSALVGGVVAGALWQVTKVVYHWYIVNYAGYDRIYGPLGAFVGLILWIYYSAVILLVGAEVAQANFEARTRPHPRDPGPPGFPSPRRGEGPGEGAGTCRVD
ncbi:MAG: YihY/virulence factor BrkB family protein [candidate division NC10 bacterium]|nr:YihY/virulence factor BrkB family protein [candidate division NC10 bacterium]